MTRPHRSSEPPATDVRPGKRIAAVVGSWPGVTSGPHRFGGLEFRVGRRELGHLHGDRIADLPFQRQVRDELIAAGQARPHHVLPESGWVTVPIDPDDVDAVIELFRLGYERAAAAAERRGESLMSDSRGDHGRLLAG